jgi:lysophospholipase L1-like esterase
MNTVAVGFFGIALMVSWAIPVACAEGFPPLQDGDRVVLLGDTFVEREGDRGFIETALVATNPAASLTIRNLGWSGDTVWAESRGVFDPPAKGYARMLDFVKELSPTVIFVAYGRNESFRGPDGLAAFRNQLATLCDDLRSAAHAEAPAAVRLVLVTPHPFEGPDAEARNAALAEYCEVIRETAAVTQAGLVDLFADLAGELPAGTAATDNGVHLSAAGYAAAARVFARACGTSLPADFVSKSAAVRQLVVEKNRLFFHRWRPANETYIFLFRKHEQGNNAVEIPQFDPLVESAEAQVRSAARQLQ